MKFLKEKTFWLMFVFFFITLFFHGCDNSKSSGGMFASPEYAVGFPLAYFIWDDTASLQFFWWALCINALIFLIVFFSKDKLFKNPFFKKYTFFLVAFHILLAIAILVNTLVQKLHLDFPKYDFRTFIIFNILSLVILLILFIKRKRISEHPVLKKHYKVLKIIYFVVLTAVIPYGMVLFASIILIYWIIVGILGSTITKFIPFLGYGIIVFLFFWIPAYILSIFLKPRNKDSELMP
jgi:hypothetical protein